MDALSILSIVLVCIGFTVHIIGIYAIVICKEKSGYGSILINLSVSEMVILLQQLIEIIARYTMGTVYEGSLLEKIDEALWYTGAPEFVITMIIILGDRVILVLYPFNYKEYTQPRNINIILLLSWIVSGTITFILLITSFERTQRAVFIIYTSVTCIYIIFTTIAYSIIISKVKRQQECQAVSNLNFKQLYKMSALIILSYNIFNSIPMCLYAYQHDWEKYTDIVYFIGLILDPCIYILYNNTYQEVLRQKKQRKCNVQIDPDPFDNISFNANSQEQMTSSLRWQQVSMEQSAHNIEFNNNINIQEIGMENISFVPEELVRRTDGLILTEPEIVKPCEAAL